MNDAASSPAVLAVHNATRESTAAFVRASVEAGITSSAVAGLNTRAADHLQVVLTEAIDALLTKDHQPMAKFRKDDDGWAAVLEARNDLYYGLIKRTREAGKAQYDADRKSEAGVRVARSGKAKSRKQYGKDARSNISNKREDIRNIFWSLQSPDLAEEVRAIMRPSADGARSSWADVRRVAAKVIQQEVTGVKVDVVHPVGEPENLWLLRGAADDYEWTEQEDGAQTTTIRWGTGDSAYDTEVVRYERMALIKLDGHLKGRESSLKRTLGKTSADIKAIADSVVPESQKLAPATGNE